MSRRRPHWWIHDYPRRRQVVLAERPVGIEPPVPVPTAAGGDVLAIVRGRFANPGSWNEVQSQREARALGFKGSRFMEYLEPNVFEQTLRERRPRIRGLWGHGQDAIPGRLPIGQLLSIEPSGRYRLALYDTQFGRDLLPALRDGQVGTSYAASLSKGIARPDARASGHNPEGLPEAVVRQSNLNEISLTAFPMDPNTTARIE
jgi:phage head maturation protease